MRDNRDSRGGRREGGFSGGGGRREGGFGGGDRGPREEHEAKCAECGKTCTVPFKPSGDRPVYCRDCFQKRKPPKRY
jgi:CxxC-x17-CxxC domain-containing protein